MLDPIELARREAINKIRAQAAEASQAFNAVVTLRANIAEVRRALEAALSDPRRALNRVARLETYIAELEHDLVEAERYCREVNADQLRSHDAEVERLAELARQVREEAEADRERALEEGRQRSAARRLEQIQQRAQHQAEQAQLMERISGVVSLTD